MVSNDGTFFEIVFVVDSRQNTEHDVTQPDRRASQDTLTIESTESEEAMPPRTISKILSKFKIKGQPKLVRTLTSAVTTAWGVNWDEEYIARDLMQNFFDANREELDQVIVREDGSDVLISAPSPFHLERLFYLGSEKGDDDVGHYGEGFKVAAACLLRDHAVTPIALSGHDVAVLRISERTVADTQMCPIEYDFHHLDEEVPGTLLILPGCSRKLIEALNSLKLVAWK